MEKLELSCIVDGNVKWGSNCRKKVQLFLKQTKKKSNIQLPYGPAILLLGVYSKEFKAVTYGYLYTHVHGLIHNSQKVETQLSINGWTDKQNAVYIYNEILFSFKKACNSDT